MEKIRYKDLVVSPSDLNLPEKTDQGLDSFYKTVEKDDEIPLDLFYVTALNHSNIGEENSQYDPF